MAKKVIFVGGTSYSGSTFFHLTLANDPAGFGAGEIRHLFRPTKERFVRGTWVCGCGDPTCTLWERIKQRGEDNLYDSIFELNPEVEFIVDASKNIVWVDEQSERLARKGYDVRHIMIWKTLPEFAHSLQKRNRLQDGAELGSWPRYHKLYYSFIDQWRAVKYGHYTQDQEATLRAACKQLGIPTFEGKERFWEKRHHVLGGNLSSRIHLYAKDSDKYQDVRRRAEGTRELGTAESHHRRVYYEEPNEAALHEHIARLRRESPDIDQIEAMLLAHDIAAPTTPGRDWPDLQLSDAEMRMRQLRQYTKDQFGRIRYALRGSRARRPTPQRARN